MMAAIRGKDTKPEFRVRKALTNLGYRYRLHRRDLPGSPDIVVPSMKVAIFVHGCFWHVHQQCRYVSMPGSKQDFWVPKLWTNQLRDSWAVDQLMLQGWRVLRVWECLLREKLEICDELSAWIEGDESVGELRGSKSLID
jgi:DNA mismatch endonuclease (patch repair protein)